MKHCDVLLQNAGSAPDTANTAALFLAVFTCRIYLPYLLAVFQRLSDFFRPIGNFFS
jgi:hypothetical protein